MANGDHSTAIILINLGTPSDLKESSIRKYLGQFLMDWRVINIHYVLRFLLINFIIKPLRPAKIKKNYQKIWFKEGSPLLVYAQRLQQKLQKIFQKTAVVDVAMRYGQPAIDRVISKHIKNGVDRMIVVPMFPQYASATIGSLQETLFDSLKDKWNCPSLTILPPYYANPLFIKAQAETAKKLLDDNFDHYIFSYHGLPIKHLFKGESKPNNCLQKGCCDKITPANRYCYRAQCMQTTLQLCKELNLDIKNTTTVFQSRFGKEPWLQPYFDETLVKLAREGKKNLLVFCPSFVADCIETLDEIAIEGKKSFIEHGGEKLVQVPCVNDTAKWAENLSQMIKFETQLRDLPTA